MTWFISCIKALSLRQNKLSQSKASPAFSYCLQLWKRQSYILLSKSQYNLLYNVANSSNRFVYNVKKFHTKVQNNMYLQYTLFFFLSRYKRTANPVCALYWTTAHRSFPLWQWTCCVYKQVQIRHWRGSKKIWSFLKCHCITASHSTSNINLPC